MKQKYQVFLVNSQGRRIFIDTTHAVSTREACNNVRYKREGKIPNRIYFDEYWEEYQAVLDKEIINETNHRN